MKNVSGNVNYLLSQPPCGKKVVGVTGVLAIVEINDAPDAILVAIRVHDNVREARGAACYNATVQSRSRGRIDGWCREVGVAVQA